ncbi:hypothetical protein SO694_00224010 [Aureococcus anophagefferens]|uniref:SREBP regulating gene protein n=1 Tax=Aureococcus anophagefferens TaxID=44056 RepID=A0ABR1G5A4_AURAN
MMLARPRDDDCCVEACEEPLHRFCCQGSAARLRRVWAGSILVAAVCAAQVALHARVAPPAPAPKPQPKPPRGAARQAARSGAP